MRTLKQAANNWKYTNSLENVTEEKRPMVAYFYKSVPEFSFIE